MWEWPSTRPGSRVAPGRSTTFAPAVSMLADGPAASMRSPRTRTAQPSCNSSPSKTRAGLRTVWLQAEVANRKQAAANRDQRIGQLYLGCGALRALGQAGRPTLHASQNLVEALVDL